jgi:hypothetical protein
VLKKGGIRMFSNKIIAIPDLVKLSTLSKFEMGNNVQDERQTDFTPLVFIKMRGLKGGKVNFDIYLLI